MARDRLALFISAIPMVLALVLASLILASKPLPTAKFNYWCPLHDGSCRDFDLNDPIDRVRWRADGRDV